MIMILLVFNNLLHLCFIYREPIYKIYHKLIKVIVIELV